MNQIEFILEEWSRLSLSKPWQHNGIEEIDRAWIKKYTSDQLERTLSWSQNMPPPNLEGICLQDLLSFNKTLDQDALSERPLDWGINLKETDVTKGITLFINKDFDSRETRIKAFLKALGVIGNTI